MSDIDLSIIVVAWNVKELLDECFTALRNSKDTLKKQIILVDNGSVDGSADFVSENYPEVELIKSQTNLGFIRANNLAYKQAVGKYILMLNSDAFVFPDTLQKTFDFMEKTPEAGVVGARLIGRDGVLQPSARFFPTPFKLFLRSIGLDGKLPFVGPLDDIEREHDTVRECDWVVGCYLLTRKEIVDKMGFFLREDYFMYNDDNDICKRINKLGYKTFFYPVDVIHLGGATAKKMEGVNKESALINKFLIESQFIYFRKNYGLFSVINNYTLTSLYYHLKIIKQVFSLKKWENLKHYTEQLNLMSKILFSTGFGSRSIH